MDPPEGEEEGGSPGKGKGNPNFCLEAIDLFFRK